MCCICPRVCIKSILIIVSVVLLVVAGAAYYAAVAAWNNDFIEAYGKDAQDAAFAIILALATLLLVASLSGLWTAYKYSGCCCFLLGVFSLVSALIFIGIFVIALIVYIDVQDVVGKENCPSTNSILENMQSAYIDMDNYFCKVCACDEQYKANFATEGGDSWNWSPTGASRVDDCDGFDSYFGDDQDIVNALVPILRHAEKSLQCSGLC